jgi:cell division septation protein DedD
MLRLALPILALALGAAAAVGLASCGRDDKGLLPGDTASQIVTNLDTVNELARAGDCSSAAAAVSDVQDEIRTLPSSVDPQLRARLTQGAQRLATVVNSPGACETTTAETTTTEPTTTETSSAEKKPKAPKPSKPPKGTTTTTTTGTTSTSTTPTEPPGPPTGGTPPGQSKDLEHGRGPEPDKRKDGD